MTWRLLKLELLRLYRKPLAKLMGGLLLFLSLLSLYSGNKAIERYRSLQQAIVSTPLAESDVDRLIEKSLWEDSFFARKLSKQAFLNAGQVVQQPEAYLYRLDRPCTPVSSFALKLPQTTLLGSLDYLWFLLWLVPWIVIVMGYDLFTAERQTRLFNLWATSQQSIQRALWARFLSLWLSTALLSGVPLLVVMAIISGPVEAVQGFLLLGVYLAFWSSLVLLVSALFLDNATTLLILGGVWLLWFAFIPSTATKIVYTTIAEPAPAERLEAELVADSFYGSEQPGLLKPMLKKYPALDPSYADSAIDGDRRSLVLTALLHDNYYQRARLAERKVEKQRNEVKSVLRWVFPGRVLSGAFGELSAENYAFEQHLFALCESRRQELSNRVIWALNGDYSAPKAPVLQPPRPRLQDPLLYYLILSLLFLGLAQKSLSVHLRRERVKSSSGN